jgi:hypothetical protein
MTEWHPEPFELAQASERGAARDLVDHLRWCSLCRSTAAEYEWLDEEIPAALDAGLAAVPKPRPEWERLHRRLELNGGRRVSRQALAVGITAAMACLTLTAPSILGGGVRAKGVPVPDVSPVRVPARAESDRTATRTNLSFTTPAAVVSSRERAVSLPFVPPPEPPDPEG